MSVSAPRWDLSNVYPSLDSKEFKAAVEDYKKQVAALEKFFKNKLSKARCQDEGQRAGSAGRQGHRPDQPDPEPVRHHCAVHLFLCHHRFAQQAGDEEPCPSSSRPACR